MPSRLEILASTQRAFLGEIRPEIRRISASALDGKLKLAVVFDTTADGERRDELVDAASVAASEIIADFPDLDIDEDYRFTAEPLPPCDLFRDGLFYERWEPRA